MASTDPHGQPLFRTLAQTIERGIVDGSYPEETQIPSTNEFALHLRINPATANKGINLLVDAGLLYKRRGIGMFVAEGARGRLLAQRTERFAGDYVDPMVAEGQRLGLQREDIVELVSERAVSAEGAVIDAAGEPASTDGRQPAEASVRRSPGAAEAGGMR